MNSTVLVVGILATAAALIEVLPLAQTTRTGPELPVAKEFGAALGPVLQRAPSLAIETANAVMPRTVLNLA